VFRMWSTPSAGSTSSRSSRSASPMRSPVTANSPIRVSKVAARRTSQLTVPRSVLRSFERNSRAAPKAVRCYAYVPIWRGRRLPVSVSIPSIRTVHLSRCLRTVGWAVAFQLMRHPGGFVLGDEYILNTST
jgi:hypothetical protein